MADPKKRGLGKGLEALLTPTSKVAAEASQSGAGGGEQIVNLDPHRIDPNPKQPRSSFHEEALEELADSIRRDGIQEPVIVRRRGDRVELVTGERRVRAAIMAGLTTVPALIRDVSDADMLRLGVIENIQREDLNAIELARAYQRLIEEFGWTQEELATQVGKKRASVTNTLRLLNLPEDVQQQVANGALTMGHARALLALPTPEAQRAASRKIIEKGLSVRDAEKLAAPPQSKKKTASKDPHLAAIEDELRSRFGTKVTIHARARSKGAISIEYYTLDDLDRILDVLRHV